MNPCTSNWNMFSVIHSTMTSAFNFIIYNSSHKLEENEEVNPMSRIEIKFPSDGSYFIVFHGRLVHCGGCSISEDNITINKSARLFSYLRVPDHNASFSGTNKRSTPRLLKYKNVLKEGTVDTTSFTMKPHSNDTDIPLCSSIQLPSNIKPLRSKNRKKKKKILSPVIGNMDEDGWEVYESVDFQKEYPNFENQFEKLVSTKGNRWKGISSTKRKLYVLSDVENVPNGILKNYRDLYQPFNNMLKLLRKIPYLDEVNLDNKAIIANLGPVPEQEPHRDYHSILRN